MNNFSFGINALCNYYSCKVWQIWLKGWAEHVLVTVSLYNNPNKNIWLKGRGQFQPKGHTLNNLFRNPLDYSTCQSFETTCFKSSRFVQFLKFWSCASYLRTFYAITFCKLWQFWPSGEEVFNTVFLYNPFENNSRSTEQDQVLTPRQLSLQSL